MKTEQAIRYVENMATLPGWKLEPTEYSNRFEGAVKLRVHVENPNTDDKAYRGGYHDEIPGGAYADFILRVGDIADDDMETVYFRVLEIIADVNMHEWREALRDRNTLVAPFHPHRDSGIWAYAEKSGRDPWRDYHYGAC